MGADDSNQLCSAYPVKKNKTISRKDDDYHGFSTFYGIILINRVGKMWELFLKRPSQGQVTFNKLCKDNLKQTHEIKFFTDSNTASYGYALC